MPERRGDTVLQAPQNGLELSSANGLAPGMAMIFDMDGVIVNSNPVHCRAWVVFNRSRGLDTTPAMLERMYGKRNDEIIRDFYGARLDEGEVRALGGTKEILYREMMAGEWREHLVPGAGNFLGRHARSPLAVASNAEAANVDFILELSGWRRYFRAVVDGDQVVHAKPHPEIYLVAAERLGVAPRNCVVFEDSFAGIAAARAAGMRVVGVQTTHRDLPGVDLAIPDFTDPELEPWVRSQTPKP